MSAYMEVITTGPDEEWATTLADELLEARLVACAQLTEIRSRYWWDGQIEHGFEVRLTLHTTGDKAPQVTSTVLATHPYETPGVLTRPVDANEAYLAWLDAETQG